MTSDWATDFMPLKTPFFYEQKIDAAQSKKIELRENNDELRCRQSGGSAVG